MGKETDICVTCGKEVIKEMLNDDHVCPTCLNDIDVRDLAEE
jgi:predicted RNA-binding Zn-ribbon protein involved in translation (DUF1610 family)